MEVVGKEMDSDLPNIGPRHICPLDKYLSGLIFSDEIFSFFVFFPVSITKDSLYDGTITQSIGSRVPEHSFPF
jgi:hypothetical protein